MTFQVAGRVMVDMAARDTSVEGRKAQDGRRPRGRFAGNADGAVAIEFAALIIPFCLLVFAILESCISFAAQQVLSNATDDVARQFRTGQIRQADLESDPFLVRNQICGKLEMLVASGCPELEVDLKSYVTFKEAADKRIAFKNNDIDTEGFDIVPGPSGSKNQLRVFYRWPVMTDFMRKSMSNLRDGKTLLYATVTWQNEPFDD
ncbi:MAG: pilus assembly protein [Aquamicrobium sp.]|uniref:TadE/TadG family type IV pilus assembly protein n=2 Tax=Aquamicrobium sp. TaxID=1872579 RepID=UPI00349EC1C5|nr:pilus assembly protein [Aquamicrobium sp.]MCO5155760.1 pilus assembly protein [Aquamicrobium sp.]